LQVIRVFKFLLMGVPRQTRKYVRGSGMTKRLKSTALRYTRVQCIKVDATKANQVRDDSNISWNYLGSNDSVLCRTNALA